MKFTKKLLVFFLASILLISAFSLSVFASDDTEYSDSSDVPIFKINESFTEITLGEDDYVPVDATYISATYVSLEVDFWTDYLLKDTIRDIKVRRSINKVLLDVTIYFVGGTSMNVSYIDTDYVREYSKLTSSSDIQIEGFPWWDTKEPFCFRTNELNNATSRNSDVTLSRSDLWDCKQYKIVKKNENFTIIRGFLILDEDGNYYYADCEKSGIFNASNFYLQGVDELKVFKIEDSELLTEMKTLVDEYKAEEEKSYTTVAILFLIIFCVTIPLITAILCFVFSFKTKKSYKTLLRVISLLSVAEIMIFVIALVIALA